jgi:MerR family regulatory protein
MDTAHQSDGVPDRLMLPSEAKAAFGVTTKTLRRWHTLGLISARKTMGGQRRYWESEVRARAAELDGAAALWTSAQPQSAVAAAPCTGPLKATPATAGAPASLRSSP